MTWEEALVARLTGDAATLALIGSIDGVPSIAWDLLPEAMPHPGIVLQTISDARPQTHDGFDGFRSTRVQVRTLAADKAPAVALREAAIAALVPAGVFGGVTFLRGFVDAVRGAGSWTSPGYVFGDIADLIIWHDF